jgi:hypothetical protein
VLKTVAALAALVVAGFCAQAQAATADKVCPNPLTFERQYDLCSCPYLDLRIDPAKARKRTMDDVLRQCRDAWFSSGYDGRVDDRADPPVVVVHDDPPHSDPPPPPHDDPPPPPHDDPPPPPHDDGGGNPCGGNCGVGVGNGGGDGTGNEGNGQGPGDHGNAPDDHPDHGHGH